MATENGHEGDMMNEEWWYSINDERYGPFSFQQLKAYIEKGELGVRHLVWKQGFEDWRRISEVDELSGVLQSIPPTLPQSTAAERNIELPVAGPWRRFVARVIDLWLIGLPTGFLAAFFLSSVSLEFALWLQRPGSAYVYSWLIIPLVLVIEALIYGIFGSTLGKAVLGVKVITVTGTKVYFSHYAKRLIGVYWSGLGTGFPFVNLFTMGHQYGRLKRGKHSGYDEGQFTVRATKLGFVRVALASLLIIGLFSVNVVLQGMSQSYNNAYYLGSNWTNNVTGKTVAIPAGWVHRNQQNAAGQPIDTFVGPRFGVFVVFAEETVRHNLSLAEYARLWSVATADVMSLSVPGQPISVRGMCALRVTGAMARDQTKKIEAVLVKKGRHMWRFVLAGTSGNIPTSKKTLELRNVLFGSIK